ncbi:Dihydrodipicolinate synthase [Exophiala xenobiotica]|uniref:Dihydrodipicolinate synthase n=1 Tax=Lithohypha guttulata TaxID=1690604 RepID=A0ABR0KPV3_9EURO|nr:Dihydrodipicolinate synthase [Lithohypha guttulata]KAK5330500.1 Dihydrodipicolinate synthase [Exophiala xenobiotica]
MASSATSSLTSTLTAPSATSTNPLNLNLRPEYEQYRANVRDSITQTITPLNTALLIALLTLTYYRLLKPSNSQAQTLNLQKEQPIVFQTFTPRTLLKFNGHPNPPLNPDGKVYLAVKGKVHDVTAGRNFYGPGGPYENFAGRDATRGLACQSFDEDMLTKDLDGPLDDCSDLGPSEMENLQGWVERFDEKYLVVGKLVAFNPRQQYGN